MAAKKGQKKAGDGSAAVNKKAYHNFELIEKHEAGMALLGSEVKSLRQHQADLTGSYVRVSDDACWLIGATISPYDHAGYTNHEPKRKRKLLLHKREIGKLRVKLEQRGFTLVPLRIYFNSRGLAKLEIALARGKKQYDKRAAIAERESKKNIDRDMKHYRR